MGVGVGKGMGGERGGGKDRLEPQCFCLTP